MGRLIHFFIGFAGTLVLGTSTLIEELGKHRSYFATAWVGGNLILACYIFFFMFLGEYVMCLYPEKKWNINFVRIAFYFIALALGTSVILAVTNEIMFERAHRV
ncbi:MAG: hypothetical protein ACKVT0_02145 [Planctomycetaceae bacterium]